MPVSPDTDLRLCLVFPRETLSVPVMRRVLGDALDRLGVNRDCIADLLLAATEACTNVLRYGGPGTGYEVAAYLDGEQCLLQVLDSGRTRSRLALRGRVVLRARVLRGRLALRRRQTMAGHPALTRHTRSRRHPVIPARSHQWRSVASLPESGRGLDIMRACVDDVSLRNDRGVGTVVSLGKRIAWRDGAPATQVTDLLRRAG